MYLRYKGLTISFSSRGRLSAGQDVVIDVDVILEGDVCLGDGVRIGAYSKIINSTLAEDVWVMEHCLIDSAQIGAGGRIGPFARVRPQTNLAEQVHIGNFVELKQATVGPGSKINHLSYMGDVVIGRNVNVGAGTITCNYDGAYKLAAQIAETSKDDAQSLNELAWMILTAPGLEKRDITHNINFRTALEESLDFAKEEKKLAKKVYSPLIFAHVRAASPGS